MQNLSALRVSTSKTNSCPPFTDKDVKLINGYKFSRGKLMLKISAITILDFASLLLGYLRKSSQNLQIISFVDLIVYPLPSLGKSFQILLAF